MVIKFHIKSVDLNNYIDHGNSLKPTFTVNKGGMVKISDKGIMEATGKGKAKVTISYGKYKLKLKVIIES